MTRGRGYILKIKILGWIRNLATPTLKEKACGQNRSKVNSYDTKQPDHLELITAFSVFVFHLASCLTALLISCQGAEVWKFFTSQGFFIKEWFN